MYSEHWSEVKNECSPEDWSQVRDEILWNNKNITIEGKSIYYRDWHAVGIKRVKDLLSSENKVYVISQRDSKSR